MSNAETETDPKELWRLPPEELHARRLVELERRGYTPAPLPKDAALLENVSTFTPRPCIPGLTDKE